MGTTIQMYAAASPVDNLANVDVPANGNLIGVDWAIGAPITGADLTQEFQISFGSTSQFTTNDARAAISNCHMVHDFTTSGGSPVQVNKYVSLPDLPVNMGERIYLHGKGTAVSTVVKATLHFDFNLDRPRTRLR